MAAILFIQPVEVFYIMKGLLDSNAAPMSLGYAHLWGDCYEACANGSFLDVAKVGVTAGLPINFGWAIEHGRLTQTLMLFVVGMLLGRRRLFINEAGNLVFWKKAMMAALLLFAVTQVLLLSLPIGEMTPCIGNSLDIQLTAWRNFSMMTFYVGGITLLYYTTSLQKALIHLECIGKMSLTDYLLQSIVGGFLFYNWGLGLYTVSSHGISFVLGIAFCICLYFFCRFWTARFRRGPLEELWSRATYMFASR